MKTYPRTKIFLLMAAFTTLQSCGPAAEGPLNEVKEPWISQDAPGHLVPGYEDRLVRLPRQGTANILPWTGHYWPTYARGLSKRWQNGDGIPLKPGLGQLRNMSQAQIAMLSPAEKYDILRGDYSYAFTNHEEDRTTPDAPGWWGLCHGWAAASLAFEEPGRATMVNRDGIRIPFAAGDVKALLTFVQQYNRSSADSDFLGLRCNRDPADDRDDCQGVNSGAFHIVLTNQVGLQNKPVIGDLRRSLQVWNYPIYGFSSRILSRSRNVYSSAAPGTVEIVQVATTIRFVSLTSPRSNPIGANDIGQFRSQTYRYRLELDRRGRIIGGEWDQQDRPDFLWTQRKARFQGFFAKMADLYEAATD